MMSSILLNQHIGRRNKSFITYFKKKGLTVLIIIGLILLPFVFLTGFKESLHTEIILSGEFNADSILNSYLISEPIIPENEISLHSEILKGITIKNYTVKNGDTLSGIASAFGIKMDTIISFNNIQNARTISKGTVLSIPDSDGLRHIVKNGESLGIISGLYNVSLYSLIDWNNLETEVLSPGQVLFIPNATLALDILNSVLGNVFKMPTSGSISSRFGYRSNPFTGSREFHYGLDIANDLGTPIYSARQGTVIKTGNTSNYGKYVIISHGDGFQTLYAHLSEILVTEGKQVPTGYKIALMGNTGYSTGPHLHFAVYKNGDAVDPEIYLE
jgi:murein DD-endopeptidase MepM/ murein hydrolase activator NlpD